MMAGRGGQNDRIYFEKLEILLGERGDKRMAALRRGELVDVQQIISDVRKSLDDLRKSLQQIKSDIDQINFHLSEVENRLNAAEQAINELDTELAALVLRINQAESSLAHLESAIATVNGQITSIGGGLQALQTDISNLQNDVSGLHSSVTTMGNDIAQIKVDINTLSVELQSVFCMHSNPGATPFPAGVFTAIPFYTPGESTLIVLTSNRTFTVSKSGLYQFELEVRMNGGAENMPPVGTGIALSIDTTTVPTSPRAGYAVADQVKTLTILRLVCVERLTANAQRVAYILNQGAAAYQVVSAVIKITRISA